MNLLDSVYSADSIEGLSVLIYAPPKTGKTGCLYEMDWEKTLLLDFDTDGHVTLVSKGIKPTVISFALLNTCVLKERIEEKFGSISKNNWDMVCNDLLEPSSLPRNNEILSFANEYRIEQIGKKHMPFFLDGDKLMGGVSKFTVLDKLSILVNSQLKDRFDTIIVDNISKLKNMMTEAYVQWIRKNLSKEMHWAVSKRLKSFDSGLLNIKSSGKTIVVMAWAMNKEFIHGLTPNGDEIKTNYRVPDVGGSWADSYAGDFSLCLEACKKEVVSEGKKKLVYYLAANTERIASRVLNSIGDECFMIKDEQGNAKRSEPYLYPNLNMILESIKKNSKGE